MSAALYPKLQQYAEARIKEFDSIPKTRKAKLKALSNYIQSKMESAGNVSVKEKVEYAINAVHESRLSPVRTSRGDAGLLGHPMQLSRYFVAD